jgi:hypothetical protein
VSMLWILIGREGFDLSTLPEQPGSLVLYLPCAAEWQSWHRVMRLSSVSSPEWLLNCWW